MCSAIDSRILATLPGFGVTTAKGYTLLQDAIVKGNIDELQFQLSILSKDDSQVAVNEICSLRAQERVEITEQDAAYGGKVPVEMVLIRFMRDPSFPADLASSFLFELFEAGANRTQQTDRKHPITILAGCEKSGSDLVKDMLGRYMDCHL